MVGAFSWLKLPALSRIAVFGVIALYCLTPSPHRGVHSTSASTIPQKVGPMAMAATPHGGGHEGGEHGGDGEEHFDEVSTAMSAVIMGGLAMLMVMVHFLNHSDPDVRRTTKDVVNNTVSIFCAVLLFTRTRSAIESTLEFLGGVRWHGAHHVWEKLGGFGEIFLLILLYALIYMDLHTRMFTFIKKGNVKAALAFGQIMAHVGGFAALYVVTDVQIFVFHKSQAKYGNHIIAFLILTTLAASALQALFAFLCESARLRRLGALEESNESPMLVKKQLETYFLEGTKEAEADVVSFSCGFLVVQVITYCIVGEIEEFHPPHIPAAAIERGQEAPNMLLVSCLVMLALYICFPLVRKLLDSGIVSERGLWYIRMTTGKTLAMAFAWGFLTWIDWQFYCVRHHKHRVEALATEAILATIFSFSLILPIDKLADRGLATTSMRTLIEVLAVMVGIAWEKTFDVAIEDLAHSVSYYSSESIPQETALKFLTVVLLLVVLPCWYWHLFPDPTSAQEGHGAHGDRDVHEDDDA